MEYAHFSDTHTMPVHGLSGCLFHLFNYRLVNLQVAFKLFGLIPGSVGLRGKVQPVGSDGDTVVSFFALLCLGCGSVTN